MSQRIQIYVSMHFKSFSLPITQATFSHISCIRNNFYNWNSAFLLAFRHRLCKYFGKKYKRNHFRKKLVEEYPRWLNYTRDYLVCSGVFLDLELEFVYVEGGCLTTKCLVQKSIVKTDETLKHACVLNAVSFHCFITETLNKHWMSSNNKNLSVSSSFCTPL